METRERAQIEGHGLMIRGGTPDEKRIKWGVRNRKKLACHGKAKFASAGLAKRVMNRDAKKKGYMSVYRCPACGAYHTGRHH